MGLAPVGPLTAINEETGEPGAATGTSPLLGATAAAAVLAPGRTTPSPGAPPVLVTAVSLDSGTPLPPPLHTASSSPPPLHTTPSDAARAATPPTVGGAAPAAAGGGLGSGSHPPARTTTTYEPDPAGLRGAPGSSHGKSGAAKATAVSLGGGRPEMTIEKGRFKAVGI